MIYRISDFMFFYFHDFRDLIISGFRDFGFQVSGLFIFSYVLDGHRNLLMQQSRRIL
jgi:hypothetical protein